MLRSLLLLVVSLFFCEVYAQEIKEDKHLIHTKKVISFYDGFVDSIAEKDTIIAIKSFKSFYKSLNKYPYRNVVRRLYRGIYNQELGRHGLALRHYLITLSKLNKFKEINKSKLTLFVYTSLNISSIYIDNGDVDMGVKYLFDAIDKAEIIKENKALTYLYASLVDLYNMEDDFSPESIKYLNKAYAYSDNMSNIVENLYIKLDLLHIFLNANMYAEASKNLSIIRTDCEMRREITDDYFYYLLNLRIATHYKDIEKMQKYISLIESIGNCDKIDLLMNLYKAKIASFSGESKKAIEYFKTVEISYKKDNDLYSLIDLYYFLSKEHIKLKHKDLAVASLEKMRFYSDSLRRYKQIKLVAAADRKYKLQKVENKLSFSNRMSKRKTRIIYAFCILLGLVIIFIARLFMLHWRIRQNYRMLVRKNQQLAQEEIKIKEEKEPVNDDLLKGIIDLIENQKIYLNPETKLATLADKLNSNTSYVSEVINKHYQKNFSNLINEYRIKQVLMKIENEDIKKYTIESLGKEVGFKSKTSFYSAFKLYTGLTPSYYIKAASK